MPHHCKPWQSPSLLQRAGLQELIECASLTCFPRAMNFDQRIYTLGTGLET